MKLTLNKYNGSDKLFFIPYAIILFFSIMMHTFYLKYFNSYYKYILVFCLSIILLREVLYRNFSKKELAGAVILYFITLLLIYRGSGAAPMSFASVFLLSFSARNVKFSKISKVSVIISAFCLIFTIISAYIGIIPNYVSISGDRIRHYLGFRYALNPSSVIANIVLLEFYRKQEKIKWREIIFLTVSEFLIFERTDSRLTFYLSIFVLILAIINKIKRDNFTNYRFISRILPSVFIICFIISVVLTVNYDSSVSWMYDFNRFLGNRLSLGFKSISLYGVNLLGNSDIEWVGNGLDMNGLKNQNTYFYVDNLYIKFLQRYGILFTILFLILTTVLVYQAYKKNDVLLEIVLAVIAIHGMIDDQIILPQFNTFWLLFGSIFVTEGLRGDSKEKAIALSLNNIENNI